MKRAREERSGKGRSGVCDEDRADLWVTWGQGRRDE